MLNMMKFIRYIAERVFYPGLNAIRSVKETIRAGFKLQKLSFISDNDIQLRASRMVRKLVHYCKVTDPSIIMYRPTFDESRFRFWEKPKKVCAV